MLPRAHALLFGLLLPASASAGAWPQGKGNVFVSLAYEWTTPIDEALAETGSGGGTMPDGTLESFGYTALYAELGVTDWLTLGIDAGQEDAPDSFQAIAFAVIALTPAEWPFKAALELGWGRREFPADPIFSDINPNLRPAGTEDVLRPGLSFGYGFGTRFGGGWTTLDLRQEYRQTRDETVQKVDLTLGVAPGDKALVYLQAQYSDYPEADPNLRLVPTYVREITSNVSVETALLADVWGSGDRIGLRAGLWLRF